MQITGMGPLPKRSDQLLGRHPKERFEVSKAPLELDEPLGPEPPEWLSPYAKWFYTQFSYSGQAKYYAPSDWAILVMLADMAAGLHRKHSAVMLGSILHGAAMLGATEFDRRRMKIELQPAGEGIEEPERDEDQMREWEASLATVTQIHKPIAEQFPPAAEPAPEFPLPPHEFEDQPETAEPVLPAEPMSPVGGKPYGAAAMLDSADILIATARETAARRRRGFTG